MSEAEDDMVEEDDMCFFMYFCICSRARAVVRGDIAEVTPCCESDCDSNPELVDERAGKQLLADVMEMTDSMSLL